MYGLFHRCGDDHPRRGGMNTGWVAVATGVSLAALPLAAPADAGGYGHMGDWFPGMGGHWMFGLFWLIVLIVLIAFVLRWLGGREDGTAARSTPLETLKQRYAKGEIDDEEFQRMRRELDR